MAHSPDDISGFTTLTGNNAIAERRRCRSSVTIEGTSYSTVTIGDQRAGIQFGTTTGAQPATTTNAAAERRAYTNPTLFYYWDDLQTEGGNIRYGDGRHQPEPDVHRRLPGKPGRRARATK